MTKNKQISPAKVPEEKAPVEDNEMENVTGGERIQSNIPVTHTPGACPVCGGGCRYEWVGATEYTVCQNCGYRKAHLSAGPSPNEPIPLQRFPQAQPSDGIPSNPIIPTMGK